mmetsp:Transcript_30810/g.73395  ORF Transcript_30810/g.73395 Transcript_30810/m.73395 type:complete len:421 (-) Transcript_30810:137-1399(-)
MRILEIRRGQFVRYHLRREAALAHFAERGPVPIARVRADNHGVARREVILAAYHRRLQHVSHELRRLVGDVPHVLLVPRRTVVDALPLYAFRSPRRRQARPARGAHSADDGPAAAVVPFAALFSQIGARFRSTNACPVGIGLTCELIESLVLVASLGADHPFKLQLGGFVQHPVRDVFVPVQILYVQNFLLLRLVDVAELALQWFGPISFAVLVVFEAEFLVKLTYALVPFLHYADEAELVQNCYRLGQVLEPTRLEHAVRARLARQHPGHAPPDAGIPREALERVGVRVLADLALEVRLALHGHAEQLLELLGTQPVRVPPVVPRRHYPRLRLPEERRHGHVVLRDLGPEVLELLGLHEAVELPALSILRVELWSQRHVLRAPHQAEGGLARERLAENVAGSVHLPWISPHERKVVHAE